MRSKKIRFSIGTGLALASGVMALSWSAMAQNPLPQSPNTAQPYNWNTVHSGGIDNPNGGPTLVNADPTNGASTPTGQVPITIGTTNTFMWTQFPSFLLGDVDSTNPLDPVRTNADVVAGAFTLPSRYYNFRQSDTGGNYVYEWFAPFVYNVAAPTLITDDSNTALFSPSSFPAPPWQQMTSASGINGGYIYAPVVNQQTPSATKAIWTLHVATGQAYYINVHAPVLTDASLPAGSKWSVDAHYFIQYLNAAGTLQQVNVRKLIQTGQNTLLGPVTMQANQDITITLDDGTYANPIPANTFVVADSASLTPAVSGATTIDDGAAGWTLVTGAWAIINSSNADAGLATVANTATGRSYRRITAQTSTVNSKRVTWTYTVPATGFYNISFHIPDSEQDAATQTKPEYRVTDARYTVQDTTTGKVWFDGRVSQTEANFNQPLGSTVYAGANDKLVVTLYSDSPTINLARASSTFIVADSMTFTPTTGADGSAPAVAVVGDPTTDDPLKALTNPATQINEFPEIADALYYGPLPGTINIIDPIPHGYKTVLVPATAPDATHAVRSLVYFGRRETAYDPTTQNTYSVGTLYCVDGITGSVVWMFKTPPIDTNPADSSKKTVWQDGDTSVLSSPAVARMNVRIDTPNSAPTFATKLCVVVADNNGRVYCLDAIGNRDGKGLQPNNGYTVNSDAEPVDGLSHVGTTTAYWIFRPDPAHPKYLYGPQKGTVKPASAYDPNSDMPVPGGFSTAAPVIYVDKGVAMDFKSLNPGKASAGSLSTNSVVYVGNSNGVLYALDGMGGIYADTDTRAATIGQHDDYYNTVPLIPINQTGAGQTDQIMTTHCRWWYSSRGGNVPSPLFNAGNAVAHVNRTASAASQRQGTKTAALSAVAAKQKAADAKKAGKKTAPKAAALHLASTRKVSVGPNAVGNTNADIEGAPALYIDPKTPSRVTVIFGTSHENEVTSNVGHVIAIRDSLNSADLDWSGPIGNGGRRDQSAAGVPVGYPNYNVDQIEAWAFPRLHTLNLTTNVWEQDRPSALGNISGSPVVYANPQQTQWGGSWVYVAANSGPEIPVGGTPANINLQPSEDSTGRIWCISPSTGLMKFAFPDAIDPNFENGTGKSIYEKPEPSAPMGAFLHATPAIGMVTFPKYIQYTAGGVVKDYLHIDESYNDTYGIANGPNPANPPPANVPMLYIGCRGQNDNGFYAVDIDGRNDAERFIYRVPSPNGADFQSASALIANSYSATAPYMGPGGMVYCSAGGSLFQFSATPLSNPAAGQAFPQVTVDAFNGFGPVSSASLAGADVTDLKPLATGTVVQDYLFAGDSASGFMHAITPRPNGSVLGGIDVGGLLPGNPDSPLIPTQQITLREPLHIHIVDTPNGKDAKSTDIVTNEAKLGQTLPMFEWGDNIYIRFTNVVPPDASGAIRLQPTAADTTDQGLPSGYYMSNGSPISFQISDYDFDGNFNGTNDGGVVNNFLSTSIGNPTNSDFNGFNRRNGSIPAEDSLVDAAGKGYYGAYSYALRDGTGRMNTPGARRKVINARQTAELHSQDAALAGNVTLESLYIPAGSKQNQSPTFGILNPIGETGGGVPLDNLQSDIATLDGVIGPLSTSGYTTTNPRTAALTNGNLYIAGGETNLPKNGDDGSATTTGDPTAPPVTGGTTLSSVPKTYQQITTATGLLNHNGSGDNGNGQDWGFHVYDRSNLYQNNQQLNIAMERTGLHWNDPVTSKGPGTVVNGLPWDTMPSSWNTGVNGSLDYPDLTRDSVSYTLDPTGAGVDIGDVPGGAPIKIQGAATQAPFAFLPVRIAVDVPQYQPANLGITSSPKTISINNPSPSNASDRFPDGYHSRVRVFVDTNRNGHWDTGEAYREVDLQSGVAVDQGTDIVENTADVGAEPHGFGIQTGNYANLGPFSPFNTKYTSAFVPLTVHNDGNVNLLNVQFNQKLKKHPLVGSNVNDTLKMTSDTGDNLSTIPAFDLQSISGNTNYLLRSSLDADLRSIGINPGFAAYNYTPPGFTFHKARVGDGQPPNLSVPDISHDNLPGSPFFVANPVKPAVGIAIPIGTPAGNYSRLIRLFEGSLPNANPLVPPSYSGNLSGQSWLDVIQSPADQIYHGAQTASITGTTVQVRVTESRITNGAGYGTLPQLNATKAVNTSNYSPAAYRDAYWSSGALQGSRNLGLYFDGARPAGFTAGATSLLGTDIFGYYMPFADPALKPGDDTAAWWKGVNTSFGLGSLFDPASLPTTSYAGVSLAQDPELYDIIHDTFVSAGHTYILYNVITSSGGKYSTALTCALLNGGVPSTTGTVTTTTAPVFHPRAVVDNLGTLWVFWHSGSRGSTQIFYSALTGSTGNGLTFSAPSVLPIPASVSQVSDPVAIPIVGPKDTVDTSPTNYIDVSYTGVAPNGTANIYTSRYLPVPKAGATVQTLALAAIPKNNEYLQVDLANSWWSARDIGWLRNNALDISIFYPNQQITAYQPLGLTNGKLDTGTGLLVFGNVTNPFTAKPMTVYIDLAAGRVRFRPELLVGASVYATFQALSRKITTDTSRPSADPVTFMDGSFTPNGAGGRTQIDRYWYIFRKTSPAGVSKAPTLYYKTQRLMVSVSDPATNKPIAFPINASGVPQIVVKTGSDVLFDGPGGSTGGANGVVVDWQRGRVYFPQTVIDTGKNASYASDGLPVTITVPDLNITWPDIVRWSDELMGSDPTAPTADHSGVGSSVSGNASTNEQELPIYNPVNEGSVSAFLDPFAYANVLAGSYQVLATAPGLNTDPNLDPAHKVWVFWSSGRNGASDIYSMTIDPKFTVDTAGQ